MDTIPITFAKLAGLQKMIKSTLSNVVSRYERENVIEYFESFLNYQNTLKSQLPELYSDMATRDLPKANNGNANYGNGYIDRSILKRLDNDIGYIFEVRANSRIGEKIDKPKAKEYIFISHGRSKEWYKLQAYVEKDLNYKTIELAQQPNLGRTVIQKLDEESNKCFSAIIAMTGDDILEEGEIRARENVMHEIGFFQGKFGIHKVVLLHEEGVNIPSNIHGIVYIPFPKDTIETTFGALFKELKHLSA